MEEIFPVNVGYSIVNKDFSLALKNNCGVKLFIEHGIKHWSQGKMVLFERDVMFINLLACYILKTLIQ